MAAAGLELKSQEEMIYLVSWLPGSVHGGSSPTWLLNTTGQIFCSLRLVFLLTAIGLNCCLEFTPVKKKKISLRKKKNNSLQ